MEKPMRYTGKRIEDYETLKIFRRQFTKPEYLREIQALNRREVSSRNAIARAEAKREQKRIAKEQARLLAVAQRKAEKAKEKAERSEKYKKVNERFYTKYGITAYEFGAWGERLKNGRYAGLSTNEDSTIALVRRCVKKVLDDFRKKHPTDGQLQVQFVGVKQSGGVEFEQKKNFDAFPATEAGLTDFMTNVLRFDSVNTQSQQKHEDYEQLEDAYVFSIVYMVVKAIRPLAGGCRNRQKVIQVEGVKVIDHQSRGKNNCFFTCCAEEFGAKYTELTRLSEKFCNTIRTKYGVKDDALITTAKAEEIYKGEFSKDISIINERLTVIQGILNADKKLMLINEHYLEYIGEAVKPQTCPLCDVEYVNKHDERACAMRQTYYKKMIKKGKRAGEVVRFVKMKAEKDEGNTYYNVLHYDIETHTQVKGKRHTPYIVGFCWYAGDDLEYRTITGDNCMKEFYDLLSTKEFEHITHINAFKGSIFDHYYLLGNLWNDENADTNTSLLMNNGRILKAEVQGKILIDLGNHLTGTLRQNLESAGCAIQKGDIDHNTTNAWGAMPEELRGDVLLYLEKDVKGLCELYNKINEDMYESEGINISDYLTTSHCAYSLWATKYLKSPVYIPTPEEDTFIRQAVYGGRCYKNKNSFKSSQYDDIMNGTIADIDSVEDFMVYLDVVSLYPTSMLEQFPIGEPEKTTKYMDGKMGIYKISYIPNKTLLTPVLPRRVENSLKWDLMDGEGVYTSVDIENAKRHGYTIEVHHGMYWENTAPIFEEYIQKFYQKKQNSVKDTAPYTTAKLYLNGLYGKMIQRPIFTKTFYPKNHMELMEVVYGHIITEMEQVGDRLVVIGTPREDADIKMCVSKPTFCGAFILSYSRQIMMNHINNTNPDNTMNKLFHYTDTDSLMTHISSMENITTGKKLGDLDNDLGTGKKIIRGIWVAPKLYMIEYAYNDNGKIVIKHKMRGKGLNAKQLTIEKFEQMNAGQAITNTAEYQMKRINVKRNNSEMNKEIFSVYHIHNTDMKANKDGELIPVLQKDVNTKAWSGRNFIDENNSVPHGYTV
jgi:hypothetical protein